ncbi:MAG: glucose/mannose-6-phosphate isomerase [Solirubrobacteraceae bacterium]|nr:glucose/mannose-6-phosphate isomerase [Solirubrobacteraceae bacterium]
MSASDPLSREAVAAVDLQDMLGDVLAQPHQIGDALWRTDAAGLPRRYMPGGLVVCGMGGSAIGGDLARAAIGSRAERPMRVVRGYDLVPWMANDALVLCSSYSGNTEETLACFDAAGQLGAPRVALTTGGTLADRARDANVPVIGVPSGMQPRAAVVYMTIASLQCATAAGVCGSLQAEAEAAAALLGRLAEEWGPDAPPGSEAKALAHSLNGTVPVVYGAGNTAGPAQRWKTQINENGKQPAFAGVLPEADHNDICAWERADEFARFSAVLLDDDSLHQQLRRRLELTARVAGDHATTVASRGETALDRVLSLVFLGDLVSVYLAVLSGVDPTPVDVLERFKQDLAQ